MRSLVRLVLLTLAFAAGTMAVHWLAVPAIALAWGLWTARERSSALLAGAAAMLGWAFLLGITAAQAPIGVTARTLAGVMQMKTAMIYAITLAFPGLLAVTAAVVGRMLRPDTHHA